MDFCKTNPSQTASRRRGSTKIRVSTIIRAFVRRCAPQHQNNPGWAYLIKAFILGCDSEKLGTRAIDLLHVAQALLLESEIFLTSDQRQAALAKAEGLRVIEV